jgi:hypothetical protein
MHHMPFCTRVVNTVVAALGNIVSVVGLFFFIYAVIGMNLWGSIREGQFLSRHANFKHMGMALLTLFRMITGAWRAGMVLGPSTNVTLDVCMAQDLMLQCLKPVDMTLRF